MLPREFASRASSGHPLPIADAAVAVSAANGLHEKRDREVEIWAELGRKLLGGEEEGEEPVVASLDRPYRGLESFGVEHAAVFFGRGDESEALANRIRRHAMLTVTGASGSGKTSLLHAGVLPRLKGARVASLRPGRRPMAALHRRLREALGDWKGSAELGEVLAEQPEGLGTILERWSRETDAWLVLVVDQGEEIFALCDREQERLSFAAALASAGADPKASTRVVISLREDFFARLSDLRPLRGLYSREVEVASTPAREDLLRVLRAPAELFGYAYEDEKLLEAMADAVAGEPAALPLLQFCANELWDRRDRSWKRLTRKAYRSLGGVAGALAAHAEATLGTLCRGRGAAPSRRPACRALTGARPRSHG